MRVGIITYDFYPPIGGQGTEAYNLYKQLMKKDQTEAFVFSSRKNSLKNHVQIPSFGRTLGPLFFSLYISLKLEKIINKYKLDILQVYGGPGGVFLVRKANIPVIYVANHTYAQQFGHFKKKIYLFLMLLEKIGYVMSKKIIAISSTTKKSLVHDYGIPPEKIIVIPVGINLDEFKPLDDIKKIPSSILYVGRLDKRKGVQYLIRALRYVVKGFPMAKLYIIGNGNLRDSLEKLARNEKVDDHVTFLGKVPMKDLVKWYNKAEVFVLPSLFEGFGIVVLEAMACGTPVIGTKVAGIVDIIENKKTGILVPPEDEKKLGEEIKRILNSPKMRKKIVYISRRYLKKKFEWESIVGNFIHLYFTNLSDDYQMGEWI